MADQDRNFHIRWQDLHMGIALLAAERCKDRAGKSGACIVNHNVFPDKPQGDMSQNAGKVVGVGYRGRPARSERTQQASSISEIHAAINAIAFKASADVHGCTIFVTKFPCIDCAKNIVQSGIKEVIYLGKNEPKQAMEILDRSDVECRPFRVQRSSITVNFE